MTTNTRIEEEYSRTIFGFWVFLLTDFMMFAVLFAVYGVLHNNTFEGPAAKEIFNLPATLAQSITLLTASFTAGLGCTFAHRKDKRLTIAFFVLTFLLGTLFLWMGYTQFSRLVNEGASWQASGFLSAFFTLAATHAVHVIFALLWIIVLLPPVILEGISAVSLRRLACLRMFWQFINIVWIFIFTIVYLLGRD